jgi:CRP-like cAMP-binding protein
LAKGKGSQEDFEFFISLDMTQNPFIAALSQVTPLTDKSLDALASKMVRLEHKAGHVLLRPGSVCDHLYFVEKGLTRTFYDKEERDITDWLSMEGEFACSILSFISRQPDRRGIELIEDSVLWRLAHSDLEELYTLHHDIERLGRLLVQMGLVQVQQRFDDLHFATAAHRYNHLMKTRPGLILRVPLGRIASYLGVTQETLSRIRGRINTF